MENASKALLIAGGILVGIITISLLFYMSTKLGETVESVSNNSEQEELLEFNKGFEVYNKKLMYGTDVLSVLNKAIDNNSRNNVQAGDNSEYSVNIIFRLKNDLQTTVEEFNSYGDKIRKYDLSGKALLENRNYSLSNDIIQIENVLINAEKFVYGDEYFSNSASQVRVNTVNGYKIIYYPAASFKRRYFYCNNVKYDDNTGRIKEMQFYEK